MYVLIIIILQSGRGRFFLFTDWSGADFDGFLCFSDWSGADFYGFVCFFGLVGDGCLWIFVFVGLVGGIIMDLLQNAGTVSIFATKRANTFALSTFSQKNTKHARAATRITPEICQAPVPSRPGIKYPVRGNPSLRSWDPIFSKSPAFSGPLVDFSVPLVDFSQACWSA